jgi:hypothetical protein
MKKIFFVISLIMIMAITSVTAFADENPIIVSLDSNEIGFDELTGRPFVDENYRTQVPFRATLEKFGADVDWDNENRVATAKKGDITVEIFIGTDYILKNGEKIVNDTTSRIVGDRTYLPIRKVMEAFGCDVQWDQDLKKVVVTSTPVDAKSILLAANDKSYAWKNYNASAKMTMHMAIPDETGVVQTIDMDMDMYMTIFMDPMKLKLTADMQMNVQGMSIIQPLMDMYMTVEDESYTTYMGMNNGTGSLTWTKTTMEDASLAELLSYDDEYIQKNKELMEKYIKDVAYLGSYTDDKGRKLSKIKYSMSGDIYNEIFNSYKDQIPAATLEEEALTEEMFKSFAEGSFGDLSIIVYIDEATGEIVKYDMDLGSMISSILGSMSGTLGMSPEDMAIFNDIDMRVTMEVLNINKAEDFTIPKEALEAPEASELVPAATTEESL